MESAPHRPYPPGRGADLPITDDDLPDRDKCTGTKIRRSLACTRESRRRNLRYCDALQ